MRKKEGGSQTITLQFILFSVIPAFRHAHFLSIFEQIHAKETSLYEVNFKHAIYKKSLYRN